MKTVDTQKSPGQGNVTTGIFNLFCWIDFVVCTVSKFTLHHV